MRLIDADALHSILADWQLMLSETYGTNDEFVRCLEDVLCTVDNAPTIPAPRWVRVEEPPKDRQKCFIAYKGPLGFIYECATYYDDINIGLGDDVYKDGTHGFVSYAEWGATSIDADYWMPIEPPGEEV